jgi:hypothetical protein
LKVANGSLLYAPTVRALETGAAFASMGDDRLRRGAAVVIPKGGGRAMMPSAAIERVRTKPRTTAALHELLLTIEREYREMPGLSVTARQAARLWGMGSTTCEFVLGILIQHGILRRTASGTYVRVRG